ncbi:MAG: aconitase family protein, partial [Anaerolineales bacterium]
TKIHQVCIGSCTNSSFENIAMFAETLKGKRVKVDTMLYPGSRKYMNLKGLMLLKSMVFESNLIFISGHWFGHPIRNRN